MTSTNGKQLVFAFIKIGLKDTWYQHQFFPPSHPLLSLSPPHAMVIFSFSIKDLEFSCSVLPLNNLPKVCYDTSQENKVLLTGEVLAHCMGREFFT